MAGTIKYHKTNRWLTSGIGDISYIRKSQTLDHAYDNIRAELKGSYETVSNFGLCVIKSHPNLKGCGIECVIESPLKLKGIFIVHAVLSLIS